MTRIIYWNNIPAPYMVERFNALVRRGSFEFEAWFSARTEKGRSWSVDERSWEFRYRYMYGGRGGWRALTTPQRLLRENVPDVFVSLYAGPAFLLGSFIAQRRGARTAFWLERTFDSVVTRRRWKESLKSRVLPKADGILTTGEDGRDFARRYAVRENRLFTVPHVVDFARYARQSADGLAEREELRSRLGLRGLTFVYVGKLTRAKGLDYLVEAFVALARPANADVSLLLVGDGADEALLRGQCEQAGVRNVVFAGFYGADTLPHLYAAGDVFVFPTLGDTFGMVVSEAMACGLPVIATSSSGEIRERVSEGVNGFIVPPADSVTLAERMALLASDAELRKRMGEASRAKVAGQSADVWAQAFEDAVVEILRMPRARDAR